jgi:hypothetical protein
MVSKVSAIRSCLPGSASVMPFSRHHARIGHALLDGRGELADATLTR